jgi:hypothetical protein
MQSGILTAAVMSSVLLLSTTEALELDPIVEAKRLEIGLARLCGTWEWTVHSHTLNHREAKSKIVLPSPESAGVAGPSPDEIRVYGDAVYLRWVYPGGYQEDSLLLNDNKRLEGTFRTSTGAVGAVNGKRLTSCRQTKAEASKSEPAGTDGKP